MLFGASANTTKPRLLATRSLTFALQQHTTHTGILHAHVALHVSSTKMYMYMYVSISIFFVVQLC